MPEEVATRPAQPARSITRPLHLQSLIRLEPPHGWQVVPLVDLGLVILLLILGSSAFVLPPGMAIGLPQIDPKLARGTAITHVLTLGSNELIFFEGRKVSPQALDRLLLELAPENEPATLLIRTDATIGLARIIEVMEAARAAGYAQVQLASRPPAARPLWETGQP